MFWLGVLVGLLAWVLLSIVLTVLLFYVGARERRDAERQSVAEDRQRAVDEAMAVIRGK